METQNWPQGVNKKAYGADNGFAENREAVEYKSGRRVYYLRNSVARKTHAVTMKFDDVTIVSGGKTEFGLFMHFFETTIKSGTVPFYFADLSNKGVGERLYYMIETPQNKGQREKIVTFTLEEA